MTTCWTETVNLISQKQKKNSSAINETNKKTCFLMKQHAFRASPA